MAYATILIYFMIYVLLTIAAGQRAELVDALDTEARDTTLHELVVAVENHRHETGTYPNGLDQLAATPGYEYLKSAIKPFQKIAIADNLSDGDFRFSRVTVYSPDNRNPQSDADFLGASNNDCGASPFSTATEWCAPLNGDTRWWKHDSREIAADEIRRERLRLNRVLAKFNAYYNDDTSVSVSSGVWGNNYPNPAATSATLVSLTGYSLTAKTCTGIQLWKKIPFDCTDLYSIWGTPTVYNFLSPTHITLLTRSPYSRADGTPIYISTEQSI